MDGVVTSTVSYLGQCTLANSSDDSKRSKDRLGKHVGNEMRQKFEIERREGEEQTESRTQMLSCSEDISSAAACHLYLFSKSLVFREVRRQM